MDENYKVPLDKVLDDMYSDNTMISSGAKDYYYENYASENEKKAYIEQQEKIRDILHIIKRVMRTICLILAGMILIMCYFNIFK